MNTPLPRLGKTCVVCVLGIGLLVCGHRVRAQSGPVKVTIQHDSKVVGEGATLPIDPTPKVRYGYQQPIMMPGLGGMNGERLTYSPQGGHEMFLQIDGQVHVIGQPPGKWEIIAKPLGKGPGGKDRLGVKSVWVIKNIHVTQIIEIIPSKAPPKGGGKRHLDVMLLKYIIENKDTKAHQVGLRNTIDIYLINNDGALFASPTTHKDQIINGHEFKGDKLPDYIQVLQIPNVKNPGYVTHFTLKLGKLEPPTRFVCTNLGACFNGNNNWDVQAQPAGDSAVAIFFDPKQIASGAKREMGYAYGIGIASNPENEGRVSLHMGGAFEVGKQFTITAYVDDPLESQGLTLELPPGLELVHGKTTQAVPQSDDTGHAVVIWKARVAKLGTHAIKIRSTNGVEYNTKLIIEEAPKGTSTSVQVQPFAEVASFMPAPKQPAGGEPTIMEIVAKLKAQGNKKAVAYEKMLEVIKKAVTELAELERRQAEMDEQLAFHKKLVATLAAKLGENDPKVKEARAKFEQVLVDNQLLKEERRIKTVYIEKLQLAKNKAEQLLRALWMEQNPQQSRVDNELNDLGLRAARLFAGQAKAKNSQ
jgi:hypothetical protein